MKCLFYLLIIGFSHLVSAQNLKEKMAEQQIMIDSLQAKIDLLNLDKDGDGVSDYFDKCPDTSKGARIDGSGCALDTDMDGIIDLHDHCITIAGPSDGNGCPPDEKRLLDSGIFGNNIEFGFRSFDLTSPMYESPLSLISYIILKYGNDYSFKIIGNSNEFKNENENIKLSQQRAQSLYEALINQKPELAEYNFEISGMGNSGLQEPYCTYYKKCEKIGLNYLNKKNNVAYIILKNKGE